MIGSAHRRLLRCDRQRAGPVHPHGRYDFEATEGGSRLTFTLDAEVSGIRKLLMGGMVQRTMEAEVAAIDNVKRLIVRSPPPLPGGSRPDA